MKEQSQWPFATPKSAFIGMAVFTLVGLIFTVGPLHIPALAAAIFWTIAFAIGLGKSEQQHSGRVLREIQHELKK